SLSLVRFDVTLVLRSPRETTEGTADDAGGRIPGPCPAPGRPPTSPGCPPRGGRGSPRPPGGGRCPRSGRAGGIAPARMGGGRRELPAEDAPAGNARVRPPRSGSGRDLGRGLPGGSLRPSPLTDRAYLPQARSSRMEAAWRAEINQQTRTMILA